MALLSSNVMYLLEKHGRQATLVKNTYGSYDPSTGTTSVSSSSSYTINAYFADYSLGEVDGDKVQLGDRKVYIGRSDINGSTLPLPDVEDTITGVGDTLVIKRVQQIYNADNLVCYICQVRE